MKGRTKSAISMVLAIAILLTTMISTSMFSGIEAKAETVISTIADDGTRNIDFNDDWQFYLATRTPSVGGGSGASGFAANGVADAGGVTTAQVISKTFDDSAWRTLNVPHDFSIEGPKLASGSAGSSQGYMQGGLGWYRKTFVLPSSMEGSQKRFIIDFEGVYQNSNVYLNGELIGNYPSGYTGFAYDITDKVTFGADEPNVLVVKVQAMAASGRWYTGAGIFRPVHLVVTHPARFVREGVKLTTPTLETTYKADGSAALNVEARMYSDASNGVVRLKTSVIDATGAVVATKTMTDPLDINPTTGLTLTDVVNVPNVKLWNPWNLGDPYLYTVKTELLFAQNGGDGEKVVDTVETAFGFRWFHFDSYNAADPNNGGLYVNDKYTKIDGVDLHHDSGALGGASFKDAYERQFTILKTMGVNSYRTSHAPPSKQVIEVCSELGFIVMEEAYDGWGSAKATYDFGNFFFVAVPEGWAGLAPNGLTSATLRPGVDYTGAGYVWSDWVTRQMVMRDINEASVLMWSVGNEVRGVGTRPSWYDGTKYSDRSGLPGTGTTATTINEFTEAVRLAEDIKAVDTSRRIAMGGDQQRTPSTQALFESTWGRVNRYLGGYGLNYNTADSIETLMARFPDTFFFESESSSQTSARGKYQTAHIKNSGVNQTPGSRGGSSYDNDFASWTMSNEYGLKKDRDNKSFTGQYIWSGFDYIGEPTPYGLFPVGVSSFGTIDTAGFPKDSYYLFRSQWTDKTTAPMVHIVPSNWNDWQEGEMVEVWVNANVQTVELFQDGVSLGTKSFDIKKTQYGKEYYETSELNPDDRTWPNSTAGGNPGGYISTHATVVSASGDSSIAEGSKFGKLHLTWYVPFKKGSLTAKAYTSPAKTTLVAEDKLVTAGPAYTVQLEAFKDVIKADGKAMTYVEATVVDKDGNVVPGANNLLKFDVTGGAIVGVDNGQQENSELYKWGNVERNSHSERTAFSGKALVILQSNKGEIGNLKLSVSSAGMVTAIKNIAVTADGTGVAPAPVPVNPTAVSITNINIATPVGIVPTLPAYVNVNYVDASAGFYAVKKAVVWNAISAANVAAAGEFAIEGTVDGVTIKATANILVVAAGAKTDVARNTALSSNNQTYDFAQLAASSTIRNGALATATYTSGTSLYPNNMVNGSNSNLWNNIGTRAQSAVLVAYNWARPNETVTFYWDSARVFDQINMEFNLTTSRQYDVPTTLNVEYWNGGEWVKASNQAVVKATTDYGTTTITFDAVNAEKVRVEMTSASANSASSAANVRGAIQIRNVSIMGYNFNDLLPEPDTSVQGVTISKAAATMRLEEELTLVASVIPAEATNKNLTWSTSDASIATVVDGKVTAIKAGTATITATAEEGAGAFKATCEITVIANAFVTTNTGDSVSVPVTAADVQNLAGFTASLSYDSEYLTFDSISAAKGFVLIPVGDKFAVLTSNGQGVSGNPIVGYILFTTKAGLLDDVTTTVRFGVTEAKNSATANISIVVPSIDVVILGTPLKLGDINGDGIVDVADAILLMQYNAGSIALTPRQIKAADMNGDGVANVGDVILLLQLCLE